jgi:hypothetical protein
MALSVKMAQAIKPIETDAEKAALGWAERWIKEGEKGATITEGMRLWSEVKTRPIGFAMSIAAVDDARDLARILDRLCNFPCENPFEKIAQAKRVCDAVRELYPSLEAYLENK